VLEVTDTIVEKLHPKWYLPKSELIEMFDLDEYTEDEYTVRGEHFNALAHTE
jgi:hypothetical protein